ncbi:hypothetical protein [Nonomuraea sp. NPDC049028]|uniref:hypothetical protein n=1 Tax=Nonomuraea sp. NPDC049028 TaxID=3364348 RepID=UPI00371E39A1
MYQTKKLARRVVTFAMTLFLAGTAMVGAASADDTPDPTPTPPVVSWTDEAGDTYFAQALTADEIKEKGLDKYVDMDNLTMTTPRLEDATTSGMKPTEPEESIGGTAAVKANGCWHYWFGYGTFSWPRLYGKTDVDWCGDGRWVRYANSFCYGYDDYTTYNYEGCSNYPNYGVGWNLYRVKTQWSLCYAYNPVWGSCLARSKPIRSYQFLGSGAVQYLGAG